jgi:ketosteroid isomerase-like protein
LDDDPGNGRAFMDRLGDDVRWTIIGSTAWPRTYAGKWIVRDELTRPLFAQFADTYTNTARRIVAEDDMVVIECRGKVTTKSGKPYNQTYCYVCRVTDGKMRELTEYLDTEVVTAALDPPGPAESPLAGDHAWHARSRVSAPAR